MSGFRMRSFRVTKTGVLKMNGYATNEYPKIYRSVSYDIPKDYIDELGIGGAFLLQLVFSISSGGFFTPNSLMIKTNLIGLFFDSLESKGTSWTVLGDSWRNIAALNEKEFNFDKVKLITEFVAENESLISRFIRN